MAVDHSLHAYALHWGRFWFFQDPDRSLFFDVLYMHNNSVIIPLLFFVIGTFVIPGIQRYGYKGYWKNRIFRYVIPFCVGVPLSVPLLTYPRYITTEDPQCSLWHYWTEVFFTHKFQAGPLWVVQSLMVYTVMAILVYRYLPGVFKRLQRGLQYIIAHPVKGFLMVGSFSALILGVTDLLWGAPWWVGFGKIFYVQGARFLQQALFFFMGVLLGSLGYGHNESLWAPLSKHWMIWVGMTLALAGAYIGYALGFFQDGAYDDTLLYALHQGGDWSSLWPLIVEVAPARLLRTTFHGFFCLCQVMMFTALFHGFAKRSSPFWDGLAANGFGIFLIHEVIVVWCQYFLSFYGLPLILKFTLVASIGISTAWGISAYLRKLPGIRIVFGPYHGL